MLQAMLVTSFLGASLAVVGVQQFLGRSRWKLLDRLERYAGSTQLDLEQEIQGQRPAGRRSILARFTVIKRYLAYLERELAQTAILLRPEEFLAGELITGMVLFIIIYIAGQPVVWALLAGVAGVYAWHLFLRRAKYLRRRAYDEQTGPALELIASSLKAGYSFLQAAGIVASESDPPMATEFKRLLKEVKMGVSLETALQDLAARIGTEDMELVVTAITIQRQVGGNLAEVLEKISHTIRERIRLKNELRALTAQGRLSAIIVIALPPVFTALVTMFNPEFMLPLITEPVGRMMLIMAVAMQILGVIIIRRIVNIEL